MISLVVVLYVIGGALYLGGAFLLFQRFMIKRQEKQKWSRTEKIELVLFLLLLIVFAIQALNNV